MMQNPVAANQIWITRTGASSRACSNSRNCRSSVASVWSASRWSRAWWRSTEEPSKRRATASVSSLYGLGAAEHILGEEAGSHKFH